MEFNSQGTKLEVCETQTGTYREMYGFYSAPDMGKDNDTIDVTNWADEVERNIDSGVRSYDKLQFEAYNNVKESTESETSKVLESYKFLRQKQDAKAKLWFKLTYPDGGSHTWKGSPNVWRLATGIKQALRFRLSVTVESAMIETYGTLPESGTQASGTQAGE